MSTAEAIILFLIAVAAFLSPFISKKLFIASPVTEIFLGIFISALFKVEGHTLTIVKFMSEFGFLILMYMAGMEIDVEDIKKISKKDLLIYVAYFVLILGMVLGFTILFKFNIAVALLGAMTAIGLLFPILSEFNLLDKKIGKDLLIIGSIGEIISLLIITGVTIYYQYGLKLESLYHILQIILFCLFAFFALKFFKVLSWWYPSTIVKVMASNNSAETGMRSNFLIMLTFVAMASVLNIEIIIGAFIGGILYSSVLKEKDNILEGFEMLGNGFMIPIFFIFVGLSFDVSTLTDKNVIILAISMTFGILLLRILASVVFIFSNISIKEIILIPIGTSFPLTLLVAFAEVGKTAGIFSPKVVSGAILTSILSALIYPPLFRFFLKFSR